MSVGKVKDFDFKSGKMTKGLAMGGSANCYAKGGKVSDSPRMMRKEVMVRETVKAPSAPQGMIKSRGVLGVIANKNPGETRMNTAPNLPGDKMMMKKGGMAMSKGGGMHTMPDGKMMKNSAMKKGGMAKSNKNC
jgi:hypothetical protein